MLIIPLIFVYFAAMINYIYNFKISRIIQIMVVCLLAGTATTIISDILADNLTSGQNLDIITWIISYIIGTPAGMYIIRMQEKDSAVADQNENGESPPIRAIKDALKRPWLIAGLLLLSFSVIAFAYFSINRQHRLADEFVKQYNTGAPNVSSISDSSFFDKELQEKTKILLRSIYERYGEIIEYRPLSSRAEGIGPGSRLAVVYKIEFKHSSKFKYLEIDSIKQKDGSYKMIGFEFYPDRPY